MADKYITLPRRPKAADPYWPGDEYLHLPHLVVYEGHDARETGLLNARGEPLYRIMERGKLGF